MQKLPVPQNPILLKNNERVEKIKMLYYREACRLYKIYLTSKRMLDEYCNIPETASLDEIFNAIAVGWSSKWEHIFENESNPIEKRLMVYLDEHIKCFVNDGQYMGGKSNVIHAACMSIDGFMGDFAAIADAYELCLTKDNILEIDWLINPA